MSTGAAAAARPAGGLGRVAARPLATLVAIALGAAVVTHLGWLGTSPPGLYQDEASIGYDAWAIAHTGRDQHGHLLPLFLESFDDWKSPLYVYLLAPLTWFLPLTAATIRLPAALAALTTCAVLWRTARRLTPSRTAATATLLTAAATPWLSQLGRLGFEVVTLVLCLAVALLCLVRAELGDGRRWFAGGGAALGLGVLAYPAGRLDVALLCGCLAAAHLPHGRPRGWWLALVGPALAYAATGAFALAHPGALTARLAVLSITHDSAGGLTVVARFVMNYLRHWNPWFLLLRGDGNPRHATGLGGEVLLVTAPALVAGAVVLVREWRRSALARLLLLAAVIAPVPAALTDEGIPHALRAATMLPVLLVVAARGWSALAGMLRDRRRLAVALAIAGALQAVAVTVDLLVLWPGRAAAAFDVGEDAVIVHAHALAAGHHVLLSDGLGDAVYAHALVTLRPEPGDDLAATLANAGVATVAPGALATAARPGDVLVLDVADLPPPGAIPVADPSVASTPSLGMRLYLAG